jgi:hypothetical protein
VQVSPEYQLPPKRLLILVDTPTYGQGPAGLRSILTQELAREIELQDLPPSLIPADRLAELRVTAEDFDRLDIAEIGRRVDAQQVLYLEILQFSLGSVLDSSTGRGEVRARVKIFDVEENRRVWPETRPLGHDVSVSTSLREPFGKEKEQALTQDLCGRTAQAVVRLFREYTKPREPENED